MEPALNDTTLIIAFVSYVWHFLRTHCSSRLLFDFGHARRLCRVAVGHRGVSYIVPQALRHIRSGTLLAISILSIGSYFPHMRSTLLAQMRRSNPIIPAATWLLLSWPISAIQNTSSIDLLQVGLSIAEDRPKGCPPWYELPHLLPCFSNIAAHPRFSAIL